MSIARSIARPIASAIASRTTAIGGGGSPAPALDILASVGTSTSPTSTGTKDIAVPFTSKVFLPFGSSQGSVGTDVQTLLTLGMATSTSNRASVAVSSRDAQTTSSTHRRHVNAAIQSSLTTLGTVSRESNLSTISADKVTLDWTTVSTAIILNHIALGGTDLEVSLTQHQMNGTNAAQSFAHGLTGGAPTGVLFFSGINDSAPPNTTANLFMSIGGWAGANQFGSTIASTHSVITTATSRALYTTGVAGWLLPGTGLRRLMAVSSVDTTNVNVTYPTTASAAQQYFWLLAIRGAKCQVGAFDTANSLSPLTIATTGIAPKLFLPIFIPSGVTSIGSVLNDLMLTIGASDGTNNVSCGISDANGVTTTNARRSQSSTTLCEFNTAGTKSFEGTAAFSGESVVITPTTVASGFGQGSYLVVGA